MSMTTDYESFLASKRVAASPTGFKPTRPMHPAMFPFQSIATEWSIRMGRAGLWLETGLGKTLCQLEWARHVVEHTNKPVLILCPLAVAKQTGREAAKFGIEATVCRKQADARPGINVTNYQMLKHFDPSKYAGVVIDESDILANFSGATKKAILEAFRDTPFKLDCSATPAPNDHLEIGNHADFLGVMESSLMISRWFVNDGGEAGAYRLKGHAVEDFWRWVASWATAIGKPSDLGYDDGPYALPPLNVLEHVVEVDLIEGRAPGQLFRTPSMSATSMHQEMRRTARARAEKTYELIMGAKPCPGSRNTKQGEGNALRSTLSTKQNGTSKASRKTGSRGGPTCEPTSPKTQIESLNCGEQRPTTSTPGVESGTPTIPSSENDAASSLGSVARSESETGDFALSTGSPETITNACSETRTERVRSADLSSPTSEDGNSPSTIATQPVPSGGFSAGHATRDSVSSEMIQSVSDERPNTSNDLPFWVVWCNTDYEQDELDRLFGDAAISIRGSDSNDTKEEKHEAWLRGERKILICKPAMFGHGLNWQHCRNVAYVGLTYSFKHVYQSLRRCWRFGQTEPVTAHMVMAETEGRVIETVKRKADDHERMKRSMVAAMVRHGLGSSYGSGGLDEYAPSVPMTLPGWMRATG